MSTGDLLHMTLKRLAANTPASTPVDKKKGTKASPNTAGETPAPAPSQGDSVEIKKDRPTVPGPGAGGGYDDDEIPAYDDGAASESLAIDPVESEGPGAGGGYASVGGAYFSHSFAHSDQSITGLPSDFTAEWSQVLPPNSYSWTGSGSLEPLLLSNPSYTVSIDNPAPAAAAETTAVDAAKHGKAADSKSKPSVKRA